MALSPWSRLAALLTLLGVACSSPAGPGQQLVPGTTGGSGGGIGFPGFDSGAGGGGGGFMPPTRDAPADERAAVSDAGAGGAGDAGPDASDARRDTGPAPDAPPPGAGAIGDKCTATATCPKGGLCAADVAGGGYCTADCTVGGICPAGAECLAVSDSAKICVKTCAQPSACRAEHVCLSGYCLPRCTKDSDCDSGNCQVATGICGASRVGGACGGDADCGQYPAFCDKTRPEGYCSLPCGGVMNLTCPVDANCVSFGSSAACLKVCAAPTDCRAGFLCAADSSGTQSCIPRCSADGDCGPGRRCEAASGRCVEGGPPQGSLGGPCMTSVDCAALGAGAFCTPDASGFPGGYCSVPCDAVACAAPGVCVETSVNMANCLSPCAAPTDCRGGYTCFALTSGNGGVCFPKCTSDADCGDPEPICDLTSGYCVPRPSGGPGMNNEVINLTPGGPVNGGVILSERFIVTVPADAVSINFVGQAVSNPNAEIFVARLEQSSNDFVTATRLYDSAAITNQVQVAPSLLPGSFSLLYPNSPSAPFTPSTATTTVKVAIRVQASSPTTMNISAIIKHSPTQALTRGKVDLNLFFVGLPELNATSARTDGRFQQILERVKSTWAKAAVDFGTVNYIEVTGADAARFTDLNATDLGDLMTRSKHPAALAGAMNVFFVHTITGDTLGGYIILGVSAGVPGVPIPGTTGSGMAVTTADFPDGLADIADTWAHEGGHNLGLFHATESGGTAFDPLPDTPECGRTRDTSRDKIMQPGECVGFGAENLMFWTSVPTIANSNLSPNQSFVMLRNPAVH